MQVLLDALEVRMFAFQRPFAYKQTLSLCQQQPRSGPGTGPWNRTPDLGPGTGSWNRALEPDPKPGSWNRILEPDPGTGPWSLALEPSVPVISNSAVSETHMRVCGAHRRLCPPLLIVAGLQAKLVSQFPKLTCLRATKPTFSRPMPPSLAHRLLRCSAVVTALAD